MPQIEVTFDIDANGILNVSAKDKATGKEQKIVIKASSGLNEDEIKRMVSDAEAHAEEDRKFRELVESRNKADALLHQTEKSLKDLGEKVQPADRANIESAMADLKRVLGEDDKSVIETKANALAQAPARSLSRPMRRRARRVKAEQRAAVRPTAEQVPAAARTTCSMPSSRRLRTARTAKLACIGPTGG